ncbi:cofactor assembly of complex C subunit B [Synechococcus sp. CS-1328]|uniref:cofactor assembly of complex C subunit B n=1 Tax=Synechococcus sp. CS-1328 TaxID=2847976 RepID=UPI00223AD334|nr:cofactor assembly of complex C subunit B [Synechococcus sp. CS-1328]MCT0226330.1 cofactor assembly of complex C subunit B [Synechococcus sp. CS-1328]
MDLPLPARVSLGVGVLGLALLVTNQLTAGPPSPALERASVLASLLAVGLMLVGVLWTRAIPEASERVALEGEQGLQLSQECSEPLARELAWGSQMLLTATPAAVVLIHWRGTTLLRRGLLQSDAFIPGAICERSRRSGKAVSLVNLKLYPGRSEFEPLLAGVPSVLVQPIGDQGWILLGGWSPRCFSRSDLAWTEGWARKLKDELAPVRVSSSDPTPSESSVASAPGHQEW